MVKWSIEDLKDVGKALQSKWADTQKLGFLIVSLPDEYKVDAKIPDPKEFVTVGIKRRKPE